MKVLVLVLINSILDFLDVVLEVGAYMVFDYLVLLKQAVHGFDLLFLPKLLIVHLCILNYINNGNVTDLDSISRILLS